MARLARFAIVLAVFVASCLAAAWASRRARPLLANTLLTFAVLAFAAAIGLTGQIFDIAGDPRAALYMSGAAGAALALAGRSTGAAAASLVLFGLGDLQDFGRTQDGFDMPSLAVMAPLGAFLAVRWRSAPLAHVGAAGLIYAFTWLAVRYEQSGANLLVLSVCFALLAGAARWLRAKGHEFSAAFYGWFVWAALFFFAIAGFAEPQMGWSHRAAWLTASAGVIALGRFDRHGLATAAGVLSLICAVASLLMDLGLELMSAAAIFFVLALAALIVGFALRRKAKA
jgi:uncharacterized membrane protein